MEPSISFAPDVVRDERVKILRAVRPLAPEDVLRETVRGQYGAGAMGGKPAPAYRAEKGVAPASNVETFVALKLFVDNWRWADVPFYLRTGKRLPRRVTEVVIQFKRAPFVLFRETDVSHIEPNATVVVTFSGPFGCSLLSDSIASVIDSLANTSRAVRNSSSPCSVRIRPRA